MKKRFESYDIALNVLGLDDLVTRRNPLCKTFANRSHKDNSIHFELSEKLHPMQTKKSISLRYHIAIHRD